MFRVGREWAGGQLDQSPILGTTITIERLKGGGTLV